MVRDAGQVTVPRGGQGGLTLGFPFNSVLIVLAVSHGLGHVLVDEII